MRLRYAILVTMLLSASHQHEVVKRESGSSEKRVVCYYTNWSVYRPGTAKFNPQNINPYLCTHLIYAFGGLDRENGLRPYDKYQDIEQGGYAKFTGLKTYNKALKTMLAIGGWNEGSARFSPLVADEERRKEFVKNVVKFLRINHFDGLDLDWEYPAYRDGGKPKDKENYGLLVQELREEFERESDKTGRPRLLLTMAVPAGIEYIDKGYDIPKLNRYLDFMNILSYDYHSAFEPSVNHHSPLYSIEEENEYNFDSQLTIDATVKHYLLKGVDAEKLVLGIPTYGRSYTLFNKDSTALGSPADGPGEQGDATREKGYLAYYEICDNVQKGNWTVVQPKETAMGPYAFKDNQWVGYDDDAIVRRKSQYVNEKHLGGIMFWSIDNDDFRGNCHSRPYPLIEAAKEALLGKAPVSNKLPTPPRGGKGSTLNKFSAKLKNHRITPAASSTTQSSVTLTTPDPPTTPDPGSDFKCKDEGFFPHPRDCKKYFWCLDSGPSNLGIVAHQFTCPSGLYFNKAADSCDFARNVPCKKKSGDSTTTTTAAPAKSASSSPKLATTTRPTTTTTTTTEAPVEEEEEEYYEEQEDPQTIKQLIMLIKKLGGVAELEKQLEGSAGDSTTPAISKSLYERVINQQTSRFQTQQRNGPTGPQNEGLPRDNSRSNFRKDKPSYVTIRRDRPTSERTSPSEYEDEEAEEESVDGNRPKYTPIQRNRGSQTEGIEADKPTTERERNKLRYQNVDRFRSRTRPDTSQTPAETEDEAEEEEIPTSSRRQLSTTLRYTNIFRGRTPADPSTSTTSRYVTLQRQRSQPAGNDAGTTENELVDSDEVVQEREVETTTTLRPSRVKVSESELPLTTTPTAIRTSTRVVTSVVEGATKRQRVPLHMLHELLKDSENFVDSVTKPYRRKAATTSSTTEAVTVSPRASGFRTRRPIVITTTVRTTPAYIALRRNRLKTPITTTEAAEASTKHKGFIPSRTRGRTTAGPSESLEETSEEDDKETKPPRGFFPRQRLTTTESSLTSTKRQIERNRFSARRSTTTAAPIEEEDKQATREYFRDTNVIRKPGGVKSRFPSRRQPTTPSANYDNSTAAITSTDKSTSPLEESSSTTEAPSTGTSSTSQTAQAEQNTTETVKSSPAANSTLEGNITPDANNSTTGEMTTEAVTNEIGEVESKDIQINSTSENSSDSSTTEAPATTSSPVSVTVPILVTSSSTSATTIPTSSANRFYRPKSHSVQIISTNETDSIIDGSNQIVRNRTKIILRRKKPTEEEVVTPLDSLGVGSTPRTAVRGEKVVIRRRKPQVTPKTPDFTDDDYGFLDNVVSSTYAPTKARGRSRFATSIRDELDEDQTTATSLRTRTTAGNQNLISRSRSSISTTVPSTRSRSRSAFDRGTTSAPATSREASSNFPSRQRTATTRRYQEISRESERASDSREGRSRSRPAAEETSKRRTPSVEREPSESARRRHRVPSPSESQAGEPEAKAARTLQRGKKKFSVQEFASLEGISEDDDGDEVPRKSSSQSRNAVSTSKRGDEQKKKVRKVILRKPVNDLAVGESGIPEQETYYNGLEDDPSNFDGETVKLFDSLIVDNDIDIVKQSLAVQNSSRSDADERDEIQRSRRPFQRRPTAVRSTTTTTTELPTTARQRTTVQILRQRLSRFKNERNQAKGTTQSIEEEDVSTTIRPRKAEFRRVIRPSSAQSLEKTPQLDSSIEQSVAKDTVTRGNQFHRETSSRSQAHLKQPVTDLPSASSASDESIYRGRVTPSGSFETSGEPDVVTIDEHSSYDSDEESIPDLANVAVAAIQSLATSAPTDATEQYITTTVRPTFREIVHQKEQPRVRPTRPPHRPPVQIPESPPIPAIVPLRNVVRSSPRPFSKVLPIPARQHPRVLGAPVDPSALYDDYDDFYAEPVEIPLSGKVRIHTDGYIECLDIGNFPHPFSCRKFISCAKMENGHLLGWEYTCPKGLSFDPIGGICNWNAGLGCKE